jgi:hypothetical protein
MISVFEISVFEMSDVVSHVICNSCMQKIRIVGGYNECKGENIKRGFQTTKDNYTIMRTPERF